MKIKFGIAIVTLVFALLSLAFSLYLSFLVLTHISATELMWFVFWLYVPMITIFQILSKIFESIEE